MQAGKLNRRISIMHLIEGQDSIGQPIMEWVELAKVWASVRNKSGAESIRADKDVSIIQTSIRIRRRTDITAAMRLVLGLETYEIEGVLLDEQNKDHVDLVCKIVHV